MQPTQAHPVAPRLAFCADAACDAVPMFRETPETGCPIGIAAGPGPAAPDPSQIHDHLDRLRSSTAFSRSSSLFAFLVYVVEETLASRGPSLKELVIGDALYSGSAPYDPGIDSTVRVEARRLRRKLADYYSQEGRTEPVRIALPVGSYRPVFETVLVELPSDARRTGRAPCAGADLAIMPFRSLSCDSNDDSFADGLTDELIFALGLRSRLRLAPRLMIFQYKGKACALSEIAENLGVGAVLHGTFRSVGTRTRVTVELSDPQGFVTWSAQVDEPVTEAILLQEKLAQAIVAQMPASMVDLPNTRSVLAVVA